MPDQTDLGAGAERARNELSAAQKANQTTLVTAGERGSASTDLVVVDQPMPTPEEIASIAHRLLDNCERCAGSLEEVARAGDRLAAGLRAHCEQGAADFRMRGQNQAQALKGMANFVDEQVETVKSLLQQADTASPPPPKRPPPPIIRPRNGAPER